MDCFEKRAINDPSIVPLDYGCRALLIICHATELAGPRSFSPHDPRYLVTNGPYIYGSSGCDEAYDQPADSPARTISMIADGRPESAVAAWLEHLVFCVRFRYGKAHFDPTWDRVH